MIETIDTITSVDPGMTMEAWQALLLVAVGDATSSAQLRERLRLTPTTCSRIIGYLSSTGTRGKPGLGLVEAEHDPRDRRRLVIRLSRSGEELVEAVLRGIEQGVYLLNAPNKAIGTDSDTT